MQGLTHRWRLSTPDEGTEARLIATGQPPIVARFLAARGFADESAAAAFLNPRLSAMHDPSRLSGVDRAAERLLAACRDGEPIVIYGDYDVDGMTASAILHRMLRHLHPDAAVTTYVPHRLEEGYGLNGPALEALAADGARVAVSVDCGVTANGPAEVARRVGLDLIITDHHNPGNDAPLPDAFAIVHPALGATPYPCRDLCGAGVAFKLAWRLATMEEGREVVSPPTREVLLDLLSLAALGTIADIVPLVDENRIIARYGLSRLRHTGVAGIDALIHAAGLAEGAIDAEAVGFMLAPRLNACGRMGHAREAVELLTTQDASRASEIAVRLDALNRDRKETERAIHEAAEALAGEAGMLSTDRRAIVLAADDWHPGVVGIVCSRLIGRHHRPTILLCRDGDVCRGSGRSIDGYNLHQGLEACASHLTRFGGHDMAAGLEVESNRLAAFTEQFIEHVNSSIDERMLTPGLRVDCEASADEFDADSVRRLLDLGPFGRGNAKPTILLRDVGVSGRPATMGSRAAHLQMHVSASNRSLRVVGWNMGELAERVPHGARLDIVVRPKLNAWRGRVTVEPEIRDLRVRERESIEVRVGAGVRQ